MPEEKKVLYSCSNCKSFLKENAINCHKCGQLLAADGAVKKKVVDKEKYLAQLDKTNPSFKLEKWYQWAFYIWGWIIGALSLLFWIIVLIVSWKNNERYEKFFSPPVKKAIYIWGIIMFCLMFFFVLLGFMIDLAM